MSGYLTTHVLDTARGTPAAGIEIALYRVSGNSHKKIATAVTNADGRTDGPILPVGSSMGGWQSLLLVRALPARIAGLVTIAAAPDFTEDGYWASFTEAQKKTLAETGQVELPSDYMEPYIITRRMIEDGRKQLVLRDPLHLPFPTRFLQGTADTAVSVATAVRLLEHAQGPDMQLQLVKDADHRFSDDRCLELLIQAVEEVSATT